MALLSTLAAGLSQAQEPVSSRAALGTAFIYQGRLSDAGGLVNGTCDLTFK